MRVSCELGEYGLEIIKSLAVGYAQTSIHTIDLENGVILILKHVPALHASSGA